MGEITAEEVWEELQKYENIPSRLIRKVVEIQVAKIKRLGLLSNTSAYLVATTMIIVANCSGNAE